MRRIVASVLGSAVAVLLTSAAPQPGHTGARRPPTAERGRTPGSRGPAREAPAVPPSSLRHEDLNAIRKAATYVREQKQTGRPGEPAGCCYDWNIELAILLRLQGYPAQFVRGVFRTDDRQPTEGVHYYIRLGDYVVDITADQFNGLLDDVNDHGPITITSDASRYLDLEDETDEVPSERRGYVASWPYAP